MAEILSSIPKCIAYGAQVSEWTALWLQTVIWLLRAPLWRNVLAVEPNFAAIHGKAAV